MTADTLIVSRDGDRAKVDHLPPIDPADARESLDALLRLCEQARRRPLPFGPKTSSAIFNAGRKGAGVDAEIAAARKAWTTQFDGPPGEGETASAQLAWRDRDPFAADTFDEWRQLAEEVFGPVEAWFARSADTSARESADG